MNINSRTEKGQFKKGFANGLKKGEKMPEEWKAKLKEARQRNPSRVKGKHWKVSEIGKINIGIAQKKKWDKIGRKEQKRYKHNGNDKRCKEWRNYVFTRDNFTCQSCGIKGYLEAHHIKSWAKYPELRYDIDNGITLCQPCHKLTDSYAGKNNGKN